MAPTVFDKLLAGRASEPAAVDPWGDVGVARQPTSGPRVRQDRRSSANPTRSADQSSLLAVFDLLPDLLATAYEEEGDSTEDVLEIQDRLVQEHRSEGAPFKWSVSYPNVSVCPTCGASLPAVKWELENPSVLRDSMWRSMHIWNETLHQVRHHGAQLLPEVAAFLEDVRDTWSGQ